MAVISYFPRANSYSKLSKTGDVMVLRAIVSSSFSPSVSSTTFASISQYLKEVYLPECTSIGYQTFCNYSSLQKISAPKCINIIQDAFRGCELLKNAIFPECTNVHLYAFSACKNLQNIYFPKLQIIENETFALYDPSHSTPFRNIYLPECTSISRYAFRYNKISSFYAPKVISIGSLAFTGGIFSLSSNVLEFPSCTTIGQNAFESVIFSNMTLKFPKCTSVHTSAFADAQFKSIYLNNCTSLGYATFINNSTLTYISIPKVSQIQACFVNATALSSISLPSCTQITTSAFYNCTALTSISAPICSQLYGSQMFISCIKLTTLSFPKLASISYGGNTSSYSTYKPFSGCTKLISIYLMNSSMCLLPCSASYVFSNCPITNSTYTGAFGSIYVPSSLLATYKANSYWKTISDRLVGI